MGEGRERERVHVPWYSSKPQSAAPHRNDMFKTGPHKDLGVTLDKWMIESTKGDSARVEEVRVKHRQLEGQTRFFT